MKKILFIFLLSIIILILEFCSVYLPVRSYLIGPEDPGFKAYGYLLLPTDNNFDDEKYLSVCKSFIGLAKIKNHMTYSQRYLYIPTYWMLTKYVDEENCDKLLKNYDYLRAKAIISYLDENFQNDILSREGPILVAFEKPFNTDSKQSKALIMDLSKLTKYQIEDAFKEWQDRIVLNPEVWSNGLKWELTRLEIEALFDKYGNHIYQFLTKSTD
ncbi:MAG: hypothetical protein V1779_10925 [bacterium]